MTESLHEATGLNILVSEPIYSERQSSAAYSYTSELDSYTQKRSAFFDFDKAVITLKGDHIDADDWLEYGLGRDISVLDAALDTTYNGFVNNMEIVAGGLTIKRGPLMGIGNRCSAVYAVLDNTVNPPTVGDRTVTVIVEDDEFIDTEDDKYIDTIIDIFE